MGVQGSTSCMGAMKACSDPAPTSNHPRVERLNLEREYMGLQNKALAAPGMALGEVGVRVWPCCVHVFYGVGEQAEEDCRGCLHASQTRPGVLRQTAPCSEVCAGRNH